MKEINFNKYYKIFNVLSSSLILVSLLLLFFKGLNLGIDFKGGTLIELRANNTTTADLRSSISKLNLGDLSVKEFGSTTDFLIKFEKKISKDYPLEKVKKDIKKVVNSKIDFRRIENVGPKVSSELLESSLIAIMLSLTAMLIYVWLRFEWQFSFGAIVALFHDVLLTLGIFSLFSIEVNLSIVAAVLTIVGYSMNDTVVIYDRVRENLKKLADLKIFEITNISINETLSRTIITSMTTLLALFSIYIFGGEILKGFSLAMILGVVFGTYSSIYIANPILVILNVSLKTVSKEDEEKSI
tara:strand:- start:1098 stop:1994 length:897 start_codon:yes stop_codon:yes gene_type:complete